MTDILKKSIPKAILTAALFTKWWYAVPVDGPDKFYWGFPLAFVGEGFQTSMSLQVFLLEFVVDFLFYVFCWMVLRQFFKRMNIRHSLNKRIYRATWILSFLVVSVYSSLVAASSPVIHWKRPYQWNVKATGYIFIWERTPLVDSKGRVND
ncbi:MAG: hypothetical protein RL021_112 [Bacteroidota bacterium]|jgi:hypothetical protein